MNTRKQRIDFAQIVVDGTYYNKYAIVCPACGKASDVSGDVQDDALREGKMTMPCCGSVESVYEDENG